MNRKIILSLLTLLLTMSAFFAPDQQVSAATYEDFTQITWTRVANQPQANSEGQGIVLNGLLYSFGGFDSKKACCTPTRRAYAYDPVADVWNPLPDMPKGLTHAGLTTDGQAIYYGGGYIENAAQTGQVFGTDQVWKYDPVLQVYSALPKLPKKNSTGSMAYLAGKLHYIGGTERDGSGTFVQDLPDHYTFDLVAYQNNPSEEWVDITATAPLPNPRQHAGIVVLDNRIYYVGGQHNHDGQLQPQKNVHYYDPANGVNGTWTQVADLPGSGLNHIGSSTVVFAGRIIVLGGQSFSGSTGAKDTVLAYDPDLNTWTNLTNLPFVQFSAVAGVIDNMIYFSAGSKQGDGLYQKATHKGVPVLLDATATPTDDPGATNTDVPSTATPTETTVPPTNTDTPTDVPATSTDSPPTATDDPAATATATDDPAATATATDDPATTATPTSTGQVDPTSTATNIPPTSTEIVPTEVQGTELLLDGSFEFDLTGDKVPDSWTPKNLTGDKMKCKPEKVYQGTCAFVFKGGPAENAKLAQNVSVASFIFAPGNTLHLSAALKAKIDVAGKFKVSIKYSDDTPKSKISINMQPTSGYQVVSDTAVITSANVAKIKVQIGHKSLTGKTFVDAVSLKLIP